MNKKFQGKTRSGKPIKNYRKRVDFVIPGVPSGVKVPGPSYGDLEKALKVFKRQVKNWMNLEVDANMSNLQQNEEKRWMMLLEQKREQFV